MIVLDGTCFFAIHVLHSLCISFSKTCLHKREICDMQLLIETDGLQTIVLTGLVRIFGDLAVEISKDAYRWIVKRIKQAVSKGRASKKEDPPNVNPSLSKRQARFGKKRKGRQ